MKKLLIPFLAFAPLAAIEMHPGSDFALTPEENIVIHNRVLLKLNGKPLSVMDVVRKMDLIFYQSYPELVDQPTMRYQFYTANWNSILGAMIDDQLILADAKDKKISANDGEVRETLEKLFGRDPLIKLNELGISYDEVHEMVKTDIIVQKLTGGMVHAKALTGVNPKKMRQLYEKLQKEHPPQEKFTYRVLSFKGVPEKEARELAKEAHRLIGEEGVPFEAIPTHFEASEANVVLSESYTRTAKEVSNAHKAVLTTLAAGSISAPILRKGTVYLFHLEALDKDELASFNEMEDELKGRIFQEEALEYNRKYREGLRKRYGLSDKHLSQLIPDDLKPFAMR